MGNKWFKIIYATDERWITVDSVTFDESAEQRMLKKDFIDEGWWFKIIGVFLNKIMISNKSIPFFVFYRFYSFLYCPVGCCNKNTQIG